jgi:hypothetical protein
MGILAMAMLLYPDRLLQRLRVVTRQMLTYTRGRHHARELTEDAEGSR